MAELSNNIYLSKLVFFIFSSVLLMLNQFCITLNHYMDVSFQCKAHYLELHKIKGLLNYIMFIFVCYTTLDILKNNNIVVYVFFLFFFDKSILRYLCNVCT